MRVDEVEVLRAALTGGLEQARQVIAMVQPQCFSDHGDRVIWIHIGEMVVAKLDPTLTGVLEALHLEPRVGRWTFTKDDDYVWSLTRGRKTNAWPLAAKRLMLAELDRLAENPQIPEKSLATLRESVTKMARRLVGEGL